MGHLIDFVPYAVLASLPVLVGFVAGHLSRSYRENVIGGAGSLALSFVVLCLLIASHYLLQRVSGGGVYRPDTVEMVVVGRFPLVVVGSTDTLALGAVGFELGAYVTAR